MSESLQREGYKPVSRLKSIVLASMGAFVAFAATRAAIVNITAGANAEMARSLDPENARALTQEGEAELGRAGSDPRHFKQVEALALSAIRSQAIAPAALRLLGFARAERARTANAEQLIALSSKVSRRDFVGQLWLIEDKVAKGDARDVLRHYDIALRTNDKAGALLYPTLFAALQDAEIRKLLVPYVRQPAPWMAEFTGVSLSTTASQANLGKLMAEARSVPSSPSYPGQEKRLLETLIDQGETALARQLFVALHPSKLGILRTADMDNASFAQDIAPMGWQLISGEGWGGDQSASGTATLFAGSGEQGVSLRKFLYLDPGDYQLAVRYGNVAVATNGGIEWRLLCGSGLAATISFKSTQHAPKTGGEFAADLVVGTSCGFQTLEARMVGGDSQTGSEIEVTMIAVAPKDQQ